MKKILLLLTLSALLFGNEIEELKVLQYKGDYANREVLARCKTTLIKTATRP